jgi:pentatricopeptide repeat protein
MGSQAIELYRQMPENLINEATHICILNACSHSGYVNEARSIFKNIQIKTERIYTTMVYQTLSYLNLKNFS